MTDWREMTRQDFDREAPAPELFQLGPSAVPASDPCGTGDLFELLGGDVD